MSARVWSLWTATFENADRIAAHDRNELSALQMLQPAHRFQALPVPGHLARLAARPNRLVPKQLPEAEVAGERRVEAKLSHKLAKSLPVRDRVDLELRRHQTLHDDRARQSVAPDLPVARAKFPLLVLKVSSHTGTSLVPDHFFQNNGHVV